MVSRSLAAIVACILLVGAWSPAQAGDLVLDEAGRVVVEIDDEGRETHYAYHPNGRISRIAYPDGRVEQFDDQGNPIDRRADP